MAWDQECETKLQQIFKGENPQTLVSRAHSDADTLKPLELQQLTDFLAF